MPSRALLDRVAEAYAHGDLHALRRLYHDDARICVAADPETVLGLDELFEQPDLLPRTQLIGSVERIPIDEHAGLLHASARIATPEGRYLSTERFWLMTFNEGLVYRQRIHETKGDAIADYAEHGIGLGLPGRAPAEQ